MVGKSNASDLNDTLTRLATMMMDHMLRKRDNIASLDKVIAKIVDANGCFNGKDVTCYLEVYKSKK